MSILMHFGGGVESKIVLGCNYVEFVFWALL